MKEAVIWSLKKYNYNRQNAKPLMISENKGSNGGQKTLDLFYRLGISASLTLMLKYLIQEYINHYWI